MTVEELLARALMLPDAERAELARRLIESLSASEPTEDEDPIWGLGRDPVDTGVVDGSTNHDQHIYRL